MIDSLKLKNIKLFSLFNNKVEKQWKIITAKSSIDNCWTFWNINICPFINNSNEKLYLEIHY